MALHLLKLCVGAQSLDSLRSWVDRTAEPREVLGGRRASATKTRMAPRRADEVTDGGSLYWVIKGSLQARQPVLGFEPFKDEAGVSRIRILMAPEVVAVRPRPCRPFQGWRYLRPEDAPVDWAAVDLDDDMPATMRRELLELCLL